MHATLRILEEIIDRCQAVVGVLSDCMSHGVAHQFIVLGRKIERADMSTRIIDIHAAVLVLHKQGLADPAIGVLWMGVLQSLHAYQGSGGACPCTHALRT